MGFGDGVAIGAVRGGYRVLGLRGTSWLVRRSGNTLAGSKRLNSAECRRLRLTSDPSVSAVLANVPASLSLTLVSDRMISVALTTPSVGRRLVRGRAVLGSSQTQPLVLTRVGPSPVRARVAPQPKPVGAPATRADMILGRWRYPSSGFHGVIRPGRRGGLEMIVMESRFRMPIIHRRDGFYQKGSRIVVNGDRMWWVSVRNPRHYMFWVRDHQPRGPAR